MSQPLFISTDVVQGWGRGSTHRPAELDILDVDTIKSVLGSAFSEEKSLPKPTVMHVVSTAFAKDPISSIVAARYEQLADPPLHLRAVYELYIRKSSVCVWPQQTPSFNCVKFQQTAAELDELITPQQASNVARATDVLLSAKPAFLPLRYPSSYNGSIEALGTLGTYSMLPKAFQTAGGSQKPCLRLVINIANVLFGDTNKQRYEPLWGSFAIYLRQLEDSKFKLLKISESVSFDFTTCDILTQIGYDAQGRDVTASSEASRVVEFRLPLDSTYNLSDVVFVMQLEQLLHHEHQNRHAIYSKTYEGDGKQAQKNLLKAATNSVIATSTTSVVSTFTKGKKTFFDESVIGGYGTVLELSKKDQNAIHSRASNVWKRVGAVRTPVSFGFASLDLPSLLLTPQPISDITPENFQNKLVQHILKSSGPIVSGDKILVTPLHKYNHSSAWSFVHFNQTFEDFITQLDGFHELLEEHYNAWMSKSIPEVRYIQASVMLQFLNTGVFYKSKKMLSIYYEKWIHSSLNPDMTINQTAARQRQLRKVFDSTVSALSSGGSSAFTGTDGACYATELAALVSGATSTSAPLTADELVRLLMTQSEGNLARDIMDMNISASNVQHPDSTATCTYSVELDNFFGRHGFMTHIGADVFSNRLYLGISKCFLNHRRSGNIVVRVELRDTDDLSSYTVIQAFYSRYIDNYNPANVSLSSLFCSSVVQMSGNEMGASKATQLLAPTATVDVPLLLPSQITCCAPHTKAAYFGTEFKLELPLVITEGMHFFFTIFCVNPAQGDKQERLISLDDTVININNMSGSSNNNTSSNGGISLGVSNFSTSMTASTIYRATRSSEATVKSSAMYRAVRNDAFTPIGFAYLPLQQFDAAKNQFINQSSDYTLLRVFESNVQPGYLSVPYKGDRMSSHLIVKCDAQSSIFVQQPLVNEVISQLTSIYQMTTKSTGSLIGTAASFGSYSSGIELSPAELVNMFGLLSTKLQWLLERLQQGTDSTLMVTLLRQLPVILMIYSLIYSSILNVRDMAESPQALASMARAFSLLVLIAKTVEGNGTSDHDVSTSYIYRLLFGACVYRTRPQYDLLLRSQPQYGKFIAKFVAPVSELGANQAARLARIDNYSKIQEPWRKTSSVSIYSLSFLLDGSACFSTPVPSLYAKSVYENVPILLQNTLYRTRCIATLHELTVFVETALLHLDTNTSLGAALQSTWYSLQEIERSMIIVLADLKAPMGRPDQAEQSPKEARTPSSSCIQGTVHSRIDTALNSRLSAIGTPAHTQSSDIDRFKTALRKLMVVLGRKMISFVIKTQDRAELLPGIARSVARIIAVCHTLHQNTLGNILTVNFCYNIQPSAVDTSWSYHGFKQMQVAASVRDQSKSMAYNRASWADIDAETLAGVEAPEIVQKNLYYCYRNIYHPFFVEAFLVALPHIHFAYSQFRRFSKAGRVDGESIPAPPDNLISLRKLSLSTSGQTGTDSVRQSILSSSVPVNGSVVRSTPCAEKNLSPPSTPFTIAAPSPSFQRIKVEQLHDEQAINDQRQRLFNCIEKLTTSQLIPPLLQYFQEIFIHCTMRCNSSTAQQIILFFKELLLDIPFYTTDIFLGGWDRYNHHSAALVRPIFYILVVSLRKIMDSKYTADIPQRTAGADTSFPADQRVDAMYGESSDISIITAQQEKAQPGSVGSLDQGHIFSVPSMTLNSLPFSITSSSAPHQTVTTLVTRTAIHLIMFAIIYDRDILHLPTTSLEHLSTVCYCISLIPKYYAPDSLASSQFLCTGSGHSIERRITSICQAATQYDLDAIVKSTEFHSATDKMACLVGIYLRQMELLYTPLYLSASPLVDTGSIQLKKRKRPTKMGIFKGVFSKKRSTSSVQGQVNEYNTTTSILITSPSGSTGGPIRGSIFDDRMKPSRNKNAFSSGRRRNSTKPRRRGEAQEPTPVKDPILDGLDTDNTDIDELSALQASLLVSSVRSSARISGQLLPTEVSDSSILLDNQSDSTLIQLCTVADLILDGQSYHALQQIDEQCIAHLNAVMILLGLFYFKRVFQQFRIIISAVKEQGDYCRIVSGGLLYPNLIGPDGLNERTNIFQEFKAVVQRDFTTSDTPRRPDHAAGKAVFKRLEEVPNSPTLVSMIKSMVTFVSLVIKCFTSCSSFPQRHYVKLIEYTRDFISGYKDYLFLDTRTSQIEPMFIHFNIYSVLFQLAMTSKDSLYKKTIDVIRMLLREENYKISKVNNISLVQISTLFSTLVTSEDDYKTMLSVIADLTKDSNSLVNVSTKLQQVLHDRNSINKIAFCTNPATGKQCYDLDFLLSLYLDQAELYFQQPEMRFEALQALFQLMMDNDRQIEAAHTAILMCSLISELTHRDASISDSYDVELRYAIIPGLLITSKSSRTALLSPVVSSNAQHQHYNGTDSPTLSSVISQIPYRLEQLWLFRECIHDFRRLLPGLTVQTDKDVIQRVFDQSLPIFSVHGFFSLLTTAADIFFRNKYYWQASVIFGLLAQMYNKSNNLTKISEIMDQYKATISRYIAGAQANSSHTYLVSFHSFEQHGTVEEYIYCNNLTPDAFRAKLRDFYVSKYPETIICGQGSRVEAEHSKTKTIRVAAVTPVVFTERSELSETILTKVQAALLDYFAKISGGATVPDQSQSKGLRNMVTASALESPEHRLSIGPFSPVPRLSQQKLESAGFNIHRYVALVLSYICGTVGSFVSTQTTGVQTASMYKANRPLYAFVFKHSYASAHGDVEKGPDGKPVAYGQVDRYCFVPYAFPSYRTRQIVIGSYSQKIPPIIAGAFRVLEKAATLAQHVQNKDPVGQVQLTLSGVLMAFVNKGPVHLAEIFLKKIVSSEQTEQSPKEFEMSSKSPTIQQIASNSSNISLTMGAGAGNLSIARVKSQHLVDSTPQAQNFQLHGVRDAVANQIQPQSRFSGAFGLSYPGLPGTTGGTYDTYSRYSIKNDELSIESRVSRTFRTSGYITCPDVSSNRESVASVALSDGGFTADPTNTCPEALLRHWEDVEPAEYLSISLKYMVHQTMIALEYSTELCKPSMSEIALQRTLVQSCAAMISQLRLYIEDWDCGSLINQCTAMTVVLEAIS